MKTTKLKFQIALLVFAIGLAWSFNQKNDLLGEWQGTAFKFEQKEGPEIPAIVEGGRAMHLQSKLQLNPNKTYQMINPDGSMNGKGIWKIEENSLILTDERQNEVSYEILKNTSNQLITAHEVGMDTPSGKVAGRILLTYGR